jgi:dephospho-CoA kinase
MRPYLIGLTGGIGTGKSTVAAELSNFGAEIISGDELGQQVLENSPNLLSRVRDRFGADVFDEKGRLIRRALGRKVFSNAEDAHWLTRLTFPGIHERWLQAVAQSKRSVIVLDAALIFEWGIEGEFDLLLIVRADRSRILSRLSAAGKWSESEIEDRLNSQISPEVKADRADVVLLNNGTIEEFRKSIREFWVSRVELESQQRRESANDRSV